MVMPELGVGFIEACIASYKFKVNIYARLGTEEKNNLLFILIHLCWKKSGNG